MGLPAVSSFLPFDHSFYSEQGSSSHGNRCCLTSYSGPVQGIWWGRGQSAMFAPSSHLLSTRTPCCQEPEDPTPRPRLLLATMLILPGFYVSLFPPQDPQPPSAPSNYLASKTQNQFFTANLPGDPSGCRVAGLQAPFLSSSLQVGGNRNSGSFRGC